MLLRVPIIGRGNANDARRCDLPTYVMLAEDGPPPRAVVWVPDEDVPDDLQRLPDAAKMDTPFGKALRVLTPLQRQAWHAHLDERYRGQDRTHRPEVG